MKNNYILDEKKVQNELEVQRQINHQIDINKSFIFKAGAGVGKTYSLVQTIKYIIQTNSKRLNLTNEKICVITYTNAAANEISERIGINEYVKCSTIHSFAWSIISFYPRELLIRHAEEVESEINLKKMKLSDLDFQKYITDIGDDKFNEIALDSQFYRLTGAAEIRRFFSCNCNNANNFYSAAKAYISIKKLEETSQKINNYLSSKPSRIKKDFLVKYDINSNFKNLNRMRIDHDLLLSYFLDLVQKYPILSKVIISKYPYILIDEYQDTSEKIMKITQFLFQQSNRKEFLLGLFGDEMQNIYNTDNSIINAVIAENELKSIYKPFNRRCASQIIEAANFFNYNNKQETIYCNHDDGNVEVIEVKLEDLDKILLNITNTYGRIDCLVLKNSTIAEKMGFKNIYELYKNTEQYSGANYDNINSELLSQDLDKLGKTQRFIFSVLDYYFKIVNNKCYLSEIIGNEKYNYSLKDISNLIMKMKNIQCQNTNCTLEMFLTEFMLSLEDNISSKGVKELLFKAANYSLEDMKNYIREVLDMSNERLDSWNELTNISFKEWKKWYKYIKADFENQKIVYHTYHGTKGLEYTNVAIVLEDKFRRNNDFKDYLINCIKYCENGDISLIDINRNFRNLLYVAVTRAINNVFILNMTTIATKEIKKIFERSFYGFTK